MLSQNHLSVGLYLFFCTHGKCKRRGKFCRLTPGECPVSLMEILRMVGSLNVEFSHELCVFQSFVEVVCA